MPDAEGVYYQSLMATMTTGKSAGFPLNLTWRPGEGSTTGRPTTAWWPSPRPGGGPSWATSPSPGKRGISHGDVIDLLREDIDGFPVREHYIRLVQDLKEKGF